MSRESASDASTLEEVKVDESHLPDRPKSDSAESRELASESESCVGREARPTYVKVKIGEREVNALIDTGCEYSLIDFGLARVLMPPGGRIPVVPSTVQMYGSTGAIVRTLGEMHVCVEVGEVKADHVVQVVDNMREPLVLGADFLESSVL